MNNKKSHIFAWILGGMVMVALASSMLSGCIGNMAQPTPTPTRTPLPAASPIPTLPPQPTMTPISVSVPTVEATMASTALPENVNPLTGEVVADASSLDRVPVAIKISNWPGQYVRPQAGINSADIIYEHYNEGWFSSRWTAIFLGQDPARVGPVRSGRIIDLELPAIYKAVFACSGFSNGVIALVKDSDLYPDWVISESLPETLNPSPFYRDTSRDVPLEHTMYSSPARIRTWATEHGISGRQGLQGMAFSDTPSEKGMPATVIKIPFNSLDVEWRYDSGSQRYLRWSDGVVHTDALDGQQLNVANVVLLYVPQYNTDIIEDPHNGALSIRWELWYSNLAVIFRDGVQIEAFWQRWDRPDMLTLTDEAGNVIPLKVGNTFFEVLPTDDEHWIDVIVQ
jgi:hypothetical protein